MPTVPKDRLPSPKIAEVFEQLCEDILNAVYSESKFVLYGRSGQKQHGIDIYSDTTDGKRIVAQCKNYHDVIHRRFTNSGIQPF